MNKLNINNKCDKKKNLKEKITKQTLKYLIDQLQKLFLKMMKVQNFLELQNILIKIWELSIPICVYIQD